MDGAGDEARAPRRRGPGGRSDRRARDRPRARRATGRRWRRRVPRRAPPSSSPAPTVTPTVAHFGEPVVADLVVVVNKTLVDPATVRVRPDFTPYAPTGQRTVERFENASSVRLRYRFTLRCLDEECAPEGERKLIELPGTGVFYRFRSASGPGNGDRGLAALRGHRARAGRGARAERWRADVTSLLRCRPMRARRARSPPSSSQEASSSRCSPSGSSGGSRGRRRPWSSTRSRPRRPGRAPSSVRSSSLARRRSTGTPPSGGRRSNASPGSSAHAGSASSPTGREPSRGAPGAPNLVVVDELEREALAATNGGPG